MANVLTLARTTVASLADVPAPVHGGKIVTRAVLMAPFLPETWSYTSLDEALDAMARHARSIINERGVADSRRLGLAVTIKLVAQEAIDGRYGRGYGPETVLETVKVRGW